MIRFHLGLFLLLINTAWSAPTLIWKNGDQLVGDILTSQSESLVWQSPFFRQPFNLKLDYLDRIEFPESSSSQPKEPFRITFQNGDRIFGDLISIDRNSVTFQSRKFTNLLVLERSQISRIERVSGSHLRYSGPIRIDDWKPLGHHRGNNGWYIQSSGDFVSHQWCGELFKEVELPDKVEITFSIQSPNQQPSFEVGLVETRAFGPKIETWGDALVLTSGNRFMQIMSLRSKRNVNLRLFWNQEEELVKVCDINGKVLAQLDNVKFKPQKTVHNSRKIKFAEPIDPFGADLLGDDPFIGDQDSYLGSNITGFRILNRTSRLHLSHLSIREWDGKSIARFDASKPRVELLGGSVRVGLKDFTLSDQGEISAGNEVLAVNQIDQLVFSTDSLNLDLSSQSRLYWHDGAVISGDFRSLTADSMSVKPRWLSSAVTVDLDAAKEIRFPNDGQGGVPAPDRIRAGNLDFGGVLNPGTNQSQGTLLAWRPLGSQNASPMVDGEEYTIERADFPGDNEVLGDARIYFTNDEVLACKLISINETEVNFTSLVTGKTSVRQDSIRAIDIEGAGLITKGFADSGWVVKQPEKNDMDEPNPAGYEPPEPNEKDEELSVELGKDAVTIKSGGFGHMNILTGDRIKFRTEWDNDYGGGMFTLRLYCSDFEGSPSTDILVALQPKRVLVGQVKPGGAFDFGNGQVAIDRPAVDFEIHTSPDRIQVIVNGKQTLELASNPKQISGNGMIFKMGGGWAWAAWSENPSVMKFSNFEVERSSGYLPRTFINEKAKQSALLIPRFHREDPPTHVLVAPNGDLLRGKLRSAQENIINYTSRGTNISIPKARVSSIIWLSKQQDTDKPESDDEEVVTPEIDSKSFHPTHYIVLKDGSRLLLESKRIDAEQEMFVGRSLVLGECSVPLAKINRSNVLISTNPLSRPISSDQLAYRGWMTSQTPDPVIPSQDAPGMDSPLIGKPAPNFTIPMLDGSEFTLADKKGSVVVLDFWATWCGPCIRAMPEVFRAVNFFKGRGRVEFCAVNQAETAPLINKFLELRKWPSSPVGLDFELKVGRDYQVKGIPHTVVIGKDGNIAWMHSGFTPELGENLANAIAQELAKN